MPGEPRYKSGIFPSQNNVVQNVGKATPAEEVWNYEAGAKTPMGGQAPLARATLRAVLHGLQGPAAVPGSIRTCGC